MGKFPKDPFKTVKVWIIHSGKRKVLVTGRSVLVVVVDVRCWRAQDSCLWSKEFKFSKFK